MGMPIITSGTGTREQAVTDLVQSVALQETALSHVLNAEGEKMQKIIAMPDVKREQLMKLNQSVYKMVNAITRLEMMFQAKMELFANTEPSGSHPPIPTSTPQAELSKINVTAVTIGVPLEDPGAGTAAMLQAKADAQSLIGNGYTADLISDGYTNGVLTGRFSVTDGKVTAEEGNARTIRVTSTAGGITAAASARAAAQFLSGSLLKGDLAGLAELKGAAAEFKDGTTPGTEAAETAGLTISLLGGQLIDVDGIQLDLGKLLTVGLANQHAKASANGASLAYAGGISNEGIAGSGSASDAPGNVVLDLMQLFPGTVLLTKASMNFLGIAGKAEWDAGLSSSAQLGYYLGGAMLSLASPLMGAFAASAETAIDGMGREVGGLSGSIVKGVLDGIAGSLSILGGLVPGAAIGANTLTASLHFNKDAFSNPLASQVFAAPGNVVMLDVARGTIHVDLNQVMGGLLNRMPPNSSLLGLETFEKIANSQEQILLNMTNEVTDLLRSLLHAVSVTITGHVTLQAVAAETAGLDVQYTGTLGDLLSGSVKPKLTGTGLLSGVIDPFAGDITTTLQTILKSAVEPLLFDPATGIGSLAAADVKVAAAKLSNGLSSLFALVDGALEVNINVQSSTENRFVEIPVQIGLLGNSAAALDLGKVMVGPNSHTA